MDANWTDQSESGFKLKHSDITDKVLNAFIRARPRPFLRRLADKPTAYLLAQPIMKVCMTHSTSQPSLLQTKAWTSRLRKR